MVRKGWFVGLRYYKATDIDHALELLEQAGENGLILAGGTDVMVDFNRTPVEADKVVVYIGDLHELARISEDDDAIHLGCLVTAAQILDSGIIKKHAYVLWEAAHESSGPQVRNRATIGGNIGTASPAGDMIAALQCLDARVTVIFKQGAAEKAIDEIITGVKKTSLCKGELMTGITIQKTKQPSASAFEKIGKRKAMSISIASASCFVKLDKDFERIEDVRIAIGAASQTTVRATDVENALRGAVISDDVIREKSTYAISSISPITDQRAPGSYRSEVVPVLVSRAVCKAVKRAVAGS